MKAEAKGELTEEGDKVTSEKFLENNKEDETQTKVNKALFLILVFQKRIQIKQKMELEFLVAKDARRFRKFSIKRMVGIEPSSGRAPAKRISVREQETGSASEDKTSLRRL